MPLSCCRDADRGSLRRRQPRLLHRLPRRRRQLAAAVAGAVLLGVPAGAAVAPAVLAHLWQLPQACQEAQVTPHRSVPPPPRRQHPRPVTQVEQAPPSGELSGGIGLRPAAIPTPSPSLDPLALLWTRLTVHSRRSRGSLPAFLPRLPASLQYASGRLPWQPLQWLPGCGLLTCWAAARSEVRTAAPLSGGPTGTTAAAPHCTVSLRRSPSRCWRGRLQVRSWSPQR